MSSSFFVSFDLTTNNHYPYQPVSTIMSKYATRARGKEEKKEKKDEKKQPSDTRDQGNDNEATSGFLFLFTCRRLCFSCYYLFKQDR
jgi:hypothetical protein